MEVCSPVLPQSFTAHTYVDRQIPSILSYVSGEELHGGQAKSQLVRNSKNTVAYFRDFLGQE
jgi:molecular chaperone DnaK (HSP70)